MTGASDQTIPPVEVEAALGRILATPEFQRNRNVSLFLKFIVEEALAGRGDKLKAFTIATLAFERGEDFDPQSDSIVRVQAMRLRQMLDAYRAGAGALEPVLILLPRGGYQPVFMRREAFRPADDETECFEDTLAIVPPPPVEKSPPATAPGVLWRLTAYRIVASLALVCVALWQLGGWFSPKPVEETAVDRLLHPPVIEVVIADFMAQADEESRNFVNYVREALQRGVSAYDNVVVRTPGSPRSTALSYKIAVSARRMQNGLYELSGQLLSDQTGNIIGGLSFKDVSSTPGDESLTRALFAMITAGGDPYGGVANFASRMAGPPVGPLKGYRCQAKAFEFVKSRSEQARLDAIQCLEAEIVARPMDAMIKSTLAAILLRSYVDALPGNKGVADVERAVLLAQNAVDLAPFMARTHFALAVARFHQGYFFEAFRQADSARDANPTSTVITSVLASLYVMRERYDEGLALMRPYRAQEIGAPAHFDSTRALAAYMRKQDEEFARLVSRPAMAASPIGLLLRIVASHKAGDAVGARDSADLLQRNFSGFAADVPASLRRYGMTQRMQETLLADLTEAGLLKARSAQP